MPLDLSTELQRFQNRLLDLTNRNPLLNFRKSKVRTLQVVDELPNKIFERLVDQNRKFKFLSATEEELRKDQLRTTRKSKNSLPPRFVIDLPSHPPSESDVKKRHKDNKLQTRLLEEKLDRVLNRINRDARRSIEESGINFLHLSLGFLEWKDPKKSAKSQLAPLMLIPIAIEREFDSKQGKYAYLATWTEDEIKFNQSLAKRIETDFGLRIPPFKPDEEPEKYFARVSRAIRTKPDWNVKRECVLGFFSFHKLLMYNDLQNWSKKKKFSDDSVISQLVCGTEIESGNAYGSEYSLDDLCDQDNVKLVLDADSSQHSALLDICSGQNLVIEGPPGTGKSQTITNAIASLISDGKSVLFVAEKLAALSVVKNKLDNLGLGDFCLELHSDNATPRSVIKSLETRIYGNYKAPEKLKNTKTKLDECRNSLQQYLSSTSDLAGPQQLPLHEVVWEIAELRGRGFAPLAGYEFGEKIESSEFEQGVESIESLSQSLQDLGDPAQSPWLHFSAENLRPNSLSRVKAVLSKMKEWSDKCTDLLKSATDSWGGEKGDWFDSTKSKEIRKLKELLGSSPPPAYQCQLLADAGFRQKLLAASELVCELKSTDEQLAGAVIEELDDESLDAFNTEVKTFLKHYADTSIEQLEAGNQFVSNYLDSTELIEFLFDLNAQFPGVELNELESIDKSSLESLAELATASAKTSVNLEKFENRQKRIVGRSLVCKLHQLRESECLLAKQQGMGDSDEFVEFGLRVLKPLLKQFGNATLGEVAQKGEQVSIFCSQMHSVAELADRIDCVGLPKPETPGQLAQASTILEYYVHPILSKFGPINARFFTPTLRAKFEEMKTEYLRLTKEKEILSECFHMPSVPGIEYVRDLQTMLRKSLPSYFRWLLADYWDAKRLLSAFWQPIRMPLLEWLRQLENLESYLELTQSFDNSKELKALFGDSFLGLGTDIEMLESVLEWVDEVKQRGVDSEIHENILSLLETQPATCQSLQKLPKQLHKAFKSGFVAKLYGNSLEAPAIDVDPIKIRFDNIAVALAKVDENISALGTPPDGLELSPDMLLEDAIDRCDLVEQVSELTNEIQDEEKWASLGSHYKGLETKPDVLISDIEWAKSVLSLNLPYPLKLLFLKEDQEFLLRSVSFLERLASEKASHVESHIILKDLILDRSKISETPDLNCIDNDREVARDFAATVSRLSHHANNLGFESGQPLLKLAGSAILLEQRRRINRQLDAPKFGDLGSFLGFAKTDHEIVGKSIAWTQKLQSLKLPIRSFTELIELREQELPRLLTTVEGIAECQGEYQNLRKELGKLGADHKTWLNLTPESTALSSELMGLGDDMAGLEAWAQFCRAKSRCVNLKLNTFVDSVLDGSLCQGKALETYRLSVLENAVAGKFDNNKSLSKFTRSTIEGARENFKSRDRQLLNLNRSMIAYQTSLAKPPAGISKGRVGEKTEMGLIRHEIGKQTRHVQIRSLLQRAGESVKVLKPCFMMSPLSVSQFLDPKSFHFDVVIMDEASQIKPEDALGAVLRAKQLVVVGDPKQLPPTSFFDRSNEEVDEESETQFDDNESILEVAMKTFHPIRRLRWHYRSQHESLIHFSNNRFYDDDLVIFPSSSKDSGTLGVYQHFVENGSFSKGINLVEAEAVAQAIAEHATYCDSQSLGVGTFNMKQAALVQDKLDEICENNSAVRVALEKLEANTEPLFIKNLENLQGDERDVIFISYTYGPDPESGKVFNRFGPLTGDGGWRRLNVMVSRARKRVEVFSSFQPTDIKTGEGKSRGVVAFRDYLEFSKSGSIHSKLEKHVEDDQIDHFEESIFRIVKKFGLKCKRKVGVAGFFVDIGIVSPYCDDTFLLGIVTDGLGYRGAKSSRDRDRLRDEVIESRNWNLHRVWSADWFLNQTNEEKRLADRIQEALETIPKEFRRPAGSTQHSEQKFSDVDICDLIVGNLKENNFSSLADIANNLSIEELKISELLTGKLAPFVYFDAEQGWSLKPELVAPQPRTKRRKAWRVTDSRPRKKAKPEISDYTPDLSDPKLSKLLVQSQMYQTQKQHASGATVNDLLTVKILSALEDCKWKTTVNALSEKVAIPPFRLRGMLPGIQRILNIDGQQALSICRESDSVELNLALLRQEFSI